ncbi:MAG: hypothetical protein MUO40_06500 [Anaerolineaceae bacterium]|nr:hypothetical protein [Anaerolineaceae bacterium]
MSSFNFEIYECTNTKCNLRFPLNPQIHSGEFCPKCGAPIRLSAHVSPTQGPRVSHSKSLNNFSGLLDNIRSVYNVGAAFRTADGVGMDHLYLCGITPIPQNNPGIAKTALGAEESIAYTYHPNSVHLGKNLVESGAHLIALEGTPNAIPLFDFKKDPSLSGEIILVAGGELAGVDPGLLALCETTLYIPMQGNKESLNVAVAFGIAAYWLAR